MNNNPRCLYNNSFISFLEETLNPNPNSSMNILYKDNMILEKYIIPVDEIISLAKKIN